MNFKHDCKVCHPLGSLDTLFDFYIHVSGDHGTGIVRYGDEGHEYYSTDFHKLADAVADERRFYGHRDVPIKELWLMLLLKKSATVFRNKIVTGGV